MLDVQNRTPFRTAIVPTLDPEGVEHAVVVIKGTFRLARGAEPTIAEEQAPLVYGDEHHGEPGLSSVRYESDLCPAKPGTDVVLIGHARAARAPVSTLDVELRAGPMRKVVRVFGDRHYVRGVSSWGLSSPQRFTEIPLVWERAFGGVDDSHPDAANHAREERNHVGVGFVAQKSARSLEGLPAPNLEDPAELLSAPGERPPPAGFGFVARSWMPRVRYAGTHDDRWREERCPLLPLDFDARFHQGAHPSLTSPKPLLGGEHIAASNVTLDGGPISFALPRRALEATLLIKGTESSHAASLDTVILEPDADRLLVTWRANVRCPRSFVYIDRVIVRERPA